MCAVCPAGITITLPEKVDEPGHRLSHSGHNLSSTPGHGL
ncbi:hypothetical protein ABGT23_01980 [Enterobacter cloacae]